MLIKYIKLVNYKRLVFHTSEIFEHTFTNKITMIKGINGSGKSSLLNELTPLPANKSDFNKNGYKEIVIEHDGNLYKLISDFTSSPKFFFYVNEENLNTSNNVTTQKELVFKHFNITESVQDLLIGSETLSTMSALNRKKLFNSITNVDLDSLIDVYNEYKEELKNKELLLKNTTNLLISEESKLSSYSIESLTNQLESVKDIINLVMEVRSNIYKYKVDRDIDQVYSKLDKANKAIKAYIDKYYLYITQYSNEYITSMQLNHKFVTDKLQELYKSLEKNLQKHRDLIHIQDANLSTLEVSKKELLLSIESNKSCLTYIKYNEDNVNSIINSIHSLETSLPSVLLELPINEDKRYSKSNYEKNIGNKSTLTSMYSKYIEQEVSLFKDIDHISSHKDSIVCPKCNHSWNKSGLSIEKLQQELTSISEQKEKCSKELKDIESYLTSYNDYVVKYRVYMSLRDSTYSNLKTFWEDIDEHSLIFTNPTSILQKLKKLNSDSVHLATIYSLTSKLRDIDKDIAFIKNNNDSLSSIEDSILQLNENIELYQYKKKELDVCMSHIALSRSVKSSLSAAVSSLEALREDFYSSNISYTISSSIKLIDDELTKMKINLIELENEISKFKTINYTIENYRKQIDVHNSHIKCLNILSDILSPKNGLIAKYTSSFLNAILTNINKVISSIWEYDMKLSYINIEEDILNYKFKVNVEDRLVIDDINNCSAGMKEVINLSFKMILYKLLTLNSYPIYLDELASNLDILHTTKMLQFINSIALDETFSQIFLVTHKENFSFLKEIDVIELS